jgi:hypothetical protein
MCYSINNVFWLCWKKTNENKWLPFCSCMLLIEIMLWLVVRIKSGLWYTSKALHLESPVEINNCNWIYKIKKINSDLARNKKERMWGGPEKIKYSGVYNRHLNFFIAHWQSLRDLWEPWCSLLFHFKKEPEIINYYYNYFKNFLCPITITKLFFV